MEERNELTIKEIRSSLGITQAAFATKFNIPLRTIENWESGKRKPPSYVLTLLEVVAKYELEKELKI